MYNSDQYINPYTLHFQSSELETKYQLSTFSFSKSFTIYITIINLFLIFIFTITMTPLLYISVIIYIWTIVYFIIFLFLLKIHKPCLLLSTIQFMNSITIGILMGFSYVQFFESETIKSPKIMVFSGLLVGAFHCIIMDISLFFNSLLQCCGIYIIYAIVVTYKFNDTHNYFPVILMFLFSKCVVSYSKEKSVRRYFIQKMKNKKNKMVWKHFLLEIHQGVVAILTKNNKDPINDLSRCGRFMKCTKNFFVKYFRFPDIPIDDSMSKKSEKENNLNINTEEIQIITSNNSNDIDRENKNILTWKIEKINKFSIKYFNDIEENFLSWIKNIKGRNVDIDIFQIINEIFDEKNDNELNNEKDFLCQYINSDGVIENLKITMCSFYWNEKFMVYFQCQNIDSEIEIKYLRELDKYKDQILASVTHDLRTPLNGINYMINKARSNAKLLYKLISEICLNFKLREGFKEYLEKRYEKAKNTKLEFNRNLDIAQANSDLLLNLISDILDYSQSKEKRLKLITSVFKLQDILSEIFSLMNIQAEVKNIKFKIDNKMNPSELFFTDMKRLKQILINLIGNAMKFTQIGSVTLVIKRDEKLSLACSGDIIKFSVKDTGVGIRDEIIPQLGDPYATFDTEGNLNKHGIGLGLNICKKIIGLLGIQEKIQIKSSLGKGSIFSFFIYRDINNKIADLDIKEEIFEVSPIIDRNTIYKEDDINNDYYNSKSKSLSIISCKSKSKTEIYDMENSNQISKKKKTISSIISPEQKIVNFANVYEIDKYSSSYSGKRKKRRKNIINSRKDSMASIHSNLSQSFKDNLIELKKMKAIVADDNPFNHLVLNEILKGFDEFKIIIKEAYNGQQAVEEFALCNGSKNEENFNIIFMDIDMPVMNGYEASKKIKNLIQEGFVNAIIVGNTGYTDDEEKIKCYENGMDFVLQKPTTKDDIFQLLKKISKIH